MSEAEGSILKAVRADIAAMGESKSGARRSLEAMALWLAAVADGMGTDSGATTTARVAQELRATLLALTRGDDDDSDAVHRIFSALSSPVRYTEDTGAPDAGAARRASR